MQMKIRFQKSHIIPEKLTLILFCTGNQLNDFYMRAILALNGLMGKI